VTREAKPSRVILSEAKDPRNRSAGIAVILSEAKDPRIEAPASSARQYGDPSALRAFRMTF
jgi:hypothetical protein